MYLIILSSPERADPLWSPFGELSPGMKQSVCESDDSFPFSAEFTNECHFGSLLILNDTHRDKFSSKLINVIANLVQLGNFIDV